MALRKLTPEQFETAMDYLRHTAGVDLTHTEREMLETRDDNPTKIIETLESISRLARECAKHMRG